jgi:hypothetical protein
VGAENVIDGLTCSFASVLEEALLRLRGRWLISFKSHATPAGRSISSGQVIVSAITE